MPLEYITLFVELVGITKKITLNTVSHEVKQKVSTTTDNILKDIAGVLTYCSENGHNPSEEKKNIILSQLRGHEATLSATIEEFALPKTCSKCGKEYPATYNHFYKDHRSKDGLRNDCKQCHKTTKKESYYQKRKSSTNGEEVDSISEEYEEISQE